MTPAQSIYRIRSREGPAEIELPGEQLTDIFGLAERGILRGTLEVYRGGELVGALRRAQNGVWEVDWHANDMPNLD